VAAVIGLCLTVGECRRKQRPLTLCLPNSAFDAAPGMSTGCPGADVTGEF
jgi:hypothetical protein